MGQDKNSKTTDSSDKVVMEVEALLNRKVHISIIPDDECATYIALLRSPIKYKLINGTAYHFETPDEVCMILESSRLNGTRMNIYCGNTDTGLDWGNGESGTVYRGGGDIRLPKLCTGVNAVGGIPILDHKILKITAYGESVLYEHFAYHQKVFIKSLNKQD